MEFSQWAFDYLRSHKDADTCKVLNGGDLNLVLSVIELMEAAWNASVSNFDPERYVNQVDRILAKQ